MIQDYEQPHEDGRLQAAGPTHGETLWTDDPARFEQRMMGVHDEVLISAARAMRDDGFVHLKGAVPAAVIRDAIQGYEAWCAEADQSRLGVRSDGRRPRVVNLHGGSEGIKGLFARSETVLRVLDFLFGYRTSVYTSLTFQYGTEQPMHRDTPVFRSEPEEFYFGCWFALEDANEENGALMALRGSHKNARVEPIAFRNQHPDLYAVLKPGGAPLWKPYQAAVVEAALSEGCQRVLIPASRGDCVIWHPQLIHGGSKVNDPRKTRLSVVFHVVPEGVPVYQADTFFSDKGAPDSPPEIKYETYEGRLFIRKSPAIGAN